MGRKLRRTNLIWSNDEYGWWYGEEVTHRVLEGRKVIREVKW